MYLELFEFKYLNVTSNERDRNRTLKIHLHRIQVRAKSDIEKGEEITTQYMPTTTKGTFYRRQELKHMWYFECGCKLCRDPTESGTMFSALKCPVCEGDAEGYLLPDDPLDHDSSWRCKMCHFTQNVQDVINQNAEMENLLDSGLKLPNVTTEGDVPELNKILLTMQNIFHENHFLVVRLKQKLGVLLGSKDGCDDLGGISNDIIKQKLSLCQDVITVKSKLEQGIKGKWKDKMDNEINRCLVELSKRGE